MKRFFRNAVRVVGIVIIILLVQNDFLYAQFATKASSNGLWSNDANWVGGSDPGFTGLGNSNITINGTYPNYISVGQYAANQNMTFAVNKNSQAITINGTLVVYGSMDFGNDAMDLVIPSGGVLIILGDLSMKNKIDLSVGGTLVVKGTFDKTGSQGTFAGGGGVYAGSYSGDADDLIVEGSGSPLLVNPDLINNPALQYIEDFLNSNGQNPLPVELLFFRAVQSGSRVDLTWATASELNFDYFSVERSFNGLDFVELEQIKGHGTTYQRKDYQLQDSNPLVGKNYYRLKSVDYDGYTEYFNVVVVNFSGEKTFSIFPNPSDGVSLTFSINFIPDSNTSITLFDNSSSIVGVVKPTGFMESVNFSTSLKSGLYFARIVNKDFVRVERFIVR